jgi:acetyl/propionyl-CoA carboxylase alpha subunit
MSDAARAAVTEAAVKAARAVGYQGAGTVEFIADASTGLRPDRIWFMEMNTRLQVEHPVTEMVTGLDLVEWQLRVAAAEPLPLAQDQIRLTGHAVEARLYAENPAGGRFLPSTGRLEHFRLPEGVRCDSAVEDGDEITPFYDPMIAKLIAYAPVREAAVAELASACDAAEVWPVKTNAGFLVHCLEEPDFIAGDVDTGFIERKLAALAPEPEPSPAALSAAAQALLVTEETADGSPWTHLTGFRLNAAPARGVRLFRDGKAVVAEVAPGAAPRTALQARDGQIVVFECGEAFAFADHPPSADGDGAGPADNEVRAPMPGKITAVAVKAGQAVKKGQTLLTLEAMKMEYALAAPFDGKVAEVSAQAGAQVVEGQILARME